MFVSMRQLNEKEEQVMQILWRLQKAFVKEILVEMSEPKPPITTLSSLVRKLDQEGIIGHESFGKTHRYFPVLQKEDYRKKSMKKLLTNYFSGKPEQLLSYFVKEERLNVDELSDLLEQIKKRDQEENR